MAGRLLGIPILLHEQNAFLGRANHMLAKFANALALSWPQTKNLPAMHHLQVTGIPVRQAFFDAAQTPYRLAATTPVNLVGAWRLAGRINIGIAGTRCHCHA